VSNMPACRVKWQEPDPKFKDTGDRCKKGGRNARLCLASSYLVGPSEDQCFLAKAVSRYLL
jgi:hypothetical protein